MGAARNLTRRESGFGVSGRVSECRDKTSCGLPVDGKTMALDDKVRIDCIDADFRGRERTLWNTVCIAGAHNFPRDRSIAKTPQDSQNVEFPES
jgi:hypothetical protein